MDAKGLGVTDPASNTFARDSEAYARARPRYPDKLYAWLASGCRRRDCAWDCATGSGQAAVGLCASFARVLATDVSAEQIAHATRRENIVYSVAAAEESGLPPRSVDLVVVAQALHWFDPARFWPEVVRVARPGAFFCAWGYDVMWSTEQVDRLVTTPLRAILAPFWAPNNRVLWDGYLDKDVHFPFRRVPAPAFAIEITWTLDHIIEYLMTWSAYKKSRNDPRAADQTDGVFARARASIPADALLPVRMPLKLLAGYVGAFEAVAP